MFKRHAQEEKPRNNRTGESRLRGEGPVKWCKFCSRVHPARACNLVEVDRIAKSGRKVKRWAHPSEEQDGK